MSAPSSPRENPLARAVGGAASGGLALAAIAAAEIAARWGAEPAVASPLRDLSLIAIGGAAGGLVVGTLRSAVPLRFLSPFGIALGLGGALHAWLGRVSGSGVLAGEASREALLGAAWLAAGALGGQLMGGLLRRMPLPRLPPAGAAGLLVLLGLPALVPPRGGPANPERPNLLLLTIDTLRADRLGFAGHPRPVSPYIDRLARRGTVHARAITPLPRTLPALASLLTGTHPHTHGVRDNFHYALGPDTRTLAEFLRERGWATAAVNSNPVLSHDSGIFQGFASANDRGDDWSRLGILRGLRRLAALIAMRRGDRAEVITDLALGWLRHRRRDRPFFLWVHWLAPHMPYEPAFPFDRLFDPGYEGEYRYAIDYERISKGEMTYGNPLPERVRRHAIALYDGEVATVDRAVGRLLREMELAGDLDRTLVVLTADHGESLVEHGYFFNHGDFVYGPAANVPLVVAGAAETRLGVSPTPVSLVDLLPTLARRLAGETPPGPVDGKGLDASPRPLFAESGFCRFPHLNRRLGWQLPREIAQSPERIPDWTARWAERANRAKQRSVEVEGWKLVRSPHEKGDRDELFDLRADPGERRDVAAARPERAAALGSLLDAWIEAGRRGGGFAPERVLDEETRRAMEALGYVGD